MAAPATQTGEAAVQCRRPRTTRTAHSPPPAALPPHRTACLRGQSREAAQQRTTSPRTRLCHRAGRHPRVVPPRKIVRRGLRQGDKDVQILVLRPRSRRARYLRAAALAAAIRGRPCGTVETTQGSRSEACRTVFRRRPRAGRAHRIRRAADFTSTMPTERPNGRRTDKVGCTKSEKPKRKRRRPLFTGISRGNIGTPVQCTQSTSCIIFTGNLAPLSC